MANRLLRYIVDDIAKDLKQVSDDKKITKAQLAYYVLISADRLKAKHIEKRRSGMFLHTFTNIAVQESTTSTNPDLVAGRKHIILPKSVYDFDKDRGIDYISYWIDEEVGNGCPPEFTNKTFTRTTQKESHVLYMNKYEKPDPSNPYFYVTGNYVYFLGIEKVPVKEVELGLYTTLDPLTTIDLDAPLDFPNELILVLKKHALDLARFALQIPEERLNNGETVLDPQTITNQKIISVNDPINQVE